MMKSEEINNLKKIREIYGKTQEEIANYMDVSRGTVINWESNNSRPGLSKMEKLSLLFGVGPEYFFEKEIGDFEEEMIRVSSKAARNFEKAKGKTKEGDINRQINDISTNSYIDKYLIFTKILLSKTEKMSLKDLKFIAQLNKKMFDRLDLIIKSREDSENSLESLIDEKLDY